MAPPQTPLNPNPQSLAKLCRAITQSQGDFALILVRCNYGALRDRLVSQLQDLCPVPLHHATLPRTSKTLFTTLQTELHNTLDPTQPQAVMVFGLEHILAIDSVLTSTNYIREEFRKKFNCPIVLWLTDTLLKQLHHLAPDFKTWGGISIRFEIEPEEVIADLEQTVKRAIATLLEVGVGRFQGNASSQLSDISRHFLEMDCAIAELNGHRHRLSPALEAGLQLLKGRIADQHGKKDEARLAYEQSLAFWQNQIQRQPSSEDWIQYGCVLIHMGLWWRQHATQHRRDYTHHCQAAKDHYQRGIQAFYSADRPDLVAKFIPPLGEVLTRLEEWTELESVAQTMVALNQQFSEPIRLAYGLGLLAEIALYKHKWPVAYHYAKQALCTNEFASPSSIDWSWERHHYRNLYRFLLAQAQIHSQQPTEAMVHLEAVKAEADPQLDPSLYIRYLTALRSLYFDQGRYLEAFQVKQETRSIEQQYGIRAFVGAGQLQSRRWVLNPGLPPVDEKLAVQQEMAASGRWEDIQHLVERVSRADYKLTVLYGQSGVGKSSLVHAGLLPVLNHRAIEARDVLPVVLQTYTDWERTLIDRYMQGLRDMNEARSVNLILSLGDLLSEMRDNVDSNTLTVLVFDQFEEFFFTYTDVVQRQPFFNFLRTCLNIPYVKVILSLREDYLHYLLEVCRTNKLDIIDNNILDKKILYYIGNFSPSDAKSVIHSLTEVSQLYLEADLIDKLIEDLAGAAGEVRPIELQVVGSQLQTDNISTIAQYQEKGPKDKLVERFLDEVVKDCGPENERIAQLVLYLLTDENGLRPRKTRSEIATELTTWTPDEAKNLDVVLDIFVLSGIVFLFPEAAETDRYQLVHDYLGWFIRQQKSAEIFKELAKERERRKQAEASYRSIARQRVRDATFGSVLALVSIAAIFFGWRAETQRQQAERAEITTLNSNSELSQLFGDRLTALETSVKASEKLRRISNPQNFRAETSDRLWSALNTVQEKNRWNAHADWVVDVDYSPDGELLASASNDRTVKLWDRDGTFVRELVGHTDGIWMVRFSPDGQTVATASSDRTIKLWRIDGTLIHTLKGHTKAVTSISFSPDGQVLISGSIDGLIKRWNAYTGELLTTIDGHSKPINYIQFSPDGQIFATASDDKTVKVWTANGTLQHQLTDHQDIVWSVTFSPDSQTIATASFDRSVKLWNRQGNLLRTLKGHSQRVLSVQFSPDGRTLASGSLDKNIILWGQDGRIVEILSKGHTDGVRGLAFHPNGRTLASAGLDRQVRIWQYNNPLVQIAQGHTDRVLGVSFSPNGQWVASASADKTIKLWSLEKLRQRQPALVRTFTGHTERVTAVNFSADSQTLVSASADRSVRLWDVMGRSQQVLSGHTDTVYSVRVSPDGQLIASASADKTIKLWSKSGQLLHTLPGHTQDVNSLSFSPDSQKLASASGDATIKIWHRSGTLLKTFPAARDQLVSISWSPDGSMIAAGGFQTISLWTPGGQLLKMLSGHKSRVWSVSFSPDSRLLASTGEDGAVKLWSVNGWQLQTWHHHRNPHQMRDVWDATFSRDGQYLLSGSSDRTVKLWQLDHDRLRTLETKDLNQLQTSACRWLQDYLNQPTKEKIICQKSRE